MASHGQKLLKGFQPLSTITSMFSIAIIEKNFIKCLVILTNDFEHRNYFSK